LIHLLNPVHMLKEKPPIEKTSGVKIVGLISDTHIPSRAKRLPDKVAEVFNDADLLIHAGDLTHMMVVEELKAMAPVVAVHGNMDPYEVKAALPKMTTVKVEGWKIGVLHDPDLLWGMRSAKRIASENNLDVLVFGHIHKPLVKREDDTLFINPGSPTNPLPPIIIKPTIGLLAITEESVKPFIIEV